MVTKQDVIKALDQLKDSKKKFNQSYDLVINLKSLDLKKPENQLDFYPTLHSTLGKPIKVCALIGPELEGEAKNVDHYLVEKDFEKYAKDPKAAKKLADQYDYFIAQANIMPKIATVFGRVFGPRKKMPNPKAGCVVPPKFALKPLYDKLQKTVHVFAKEKLIIQVRIGSEEQKPEEIADNVETIITMIVQKLPLEKNNIKSIFIKKTMSKPVRLM